MTYKLHFIKEAKKEWDKLNQGIKTQFKKKLRERLAQPHVPSAKMRSMKGCYKIKIRNLGYRLVYSVDDDKIIVMVLAVGKRDKNKVYKDAIKYFFSLPSLEDFPEREQPDHQDRDDF